MNARFTSSNRPRGATPDTMLASERSGPTHYRACIRHTISLQSPYAFLQFCPTAE